MGDRVSFFFSMKEANPQYPEKTVVWQRWQLSCKKSGDCSSLIFYKLSDSGAGHPCSISQESHDTAKIATIRFDLAAGAVVVKVDEYHLGAGDLRIEFDPKTYRIRSAEVDFIQKAESPDEQDSSPFARDQDEIRKFRMPERSSVVRPACVFHEEGAQPLS
ncbi:MAG: hypothetical protein ABL955_06750 [Elusimicrobiota bacterium]